MTSFSESSVTCSVCGNISSQPVLASTNRFGPPDLDLRPSEMMRSTMSAWVQRCPSCGFAAPTLEKIEPAAKSIMVGAPYQHRTNDTMLPELANRFLCWSIIAEASNPVDAASASLRAAWTCDDAANAEGALMCRERAADWFVRAIEAKLGEVDTLSVILVDVLRRAGRFEEANQRTDALLAGDLEPVMRKVLEFQKTLLSSSDVTCHAMSDVPSLGPSQGISPP